VSAVLKGKGVRPEVKIFPENGLLPFGAVVKGDQSEKTFQIKNVSHFAIKYKLVAIVDGLKNFNNSEVFGFIPTEGSIEAQKEAQIQVVFRPDRVGEKFYSLIVIDAPN